MVVDLSLQDFCLWHASIYWQCRRNNGIAPFDSVGSSSPFLGSYAFARISASLIANNGCWSLHEAFDSAAITGQLAEHVAHISIGLAMQEAIYQGA